MRSAGLEWVDYGDMLVLINKTDRAAIVITSGGYADVFWLWVDPQVALYFCRDVVEADQRTIACTCFVDGNLTEADARRHCPEFFNWFESLKAAVGNFMEEMER